ncbi:hypothetical protein QFC19_007601 [Naganishia cerealis]|uniref:Uncharacterized protein n=1 Tax=Naganishia cerealis TaxID=610337 RepID=A0ACC2V9X5_9TREE|nr:hypothetical protein QFC19_007601 [Naganishia cerealis]
MHSPDAPPRLTQDEILARSQEIQQTHAPDSPTTMLVTTLRDELLTLTDQSAVLNAKLIASLDRVASLEDTVYHKTSAEQRKDQLIDELQQAKAQWEESMNTGLLVERKSVKEEMQRLVDGLVEEERRRGSAEEGRARVENEVDDLSATLFEQANTMVAAEKMARAQAETRLRQAEENLAAAEAAMRDMQHHLQSLPTLLPPADVGPSAGGHTTALVRAREYTTTHVPYAEFIAFIQHIRLHKPRKPEHIALIPPPTLSTLLSQPFIARSQVEDIDPALRLEQAPDLSWLTRRSVGQAILAGELVIEPVSMNTLRGCKEYATVHPADIACSMCGKPVIRRPVVAAEEDGTGESQLPPPTLASQQQQQPLKHPSTTRNNSTSRFSLKPFFSSPSATPSPSSSPGPSASAATTTTGGSTATTPRTSARIAPTTLFIFRITSDSTASASDPSPVVAGGAAGGRMYPLCASGWCLGRLRAVCEWWRFVRMNMIDVIWRGDDGYAQPLLLTQNGRVLPPPPLGSKHASVNDLHLPPPPPTSMPVTPVHEKNGVHAAAEDVTESPAAGGPELPPRKKSGWTLGFKNLGGGKGLGLASAKSGTLSSTTPPPPPPEPPLMSSATEEEEEDKDVHGFTPVDVTMGDTTTRDDTPHEVDAEQSVSPTASKEDISLDVDPVKRDDDDENVGPTSSAASETSENTNTFNTPQSTNAPLSPEHNRDREEHHSAETVEEEKREEEIPVPGDDTPTDNDDDQANPSSSTPPTPTRPARRAVPAPPLTPGTPTTPTTPTTGTTTAPPSIPQRSRARPTTLTLLDSQAARDGEERDVPVAEEVVEEEEENIPAAPALDSAAYITPDPSSTAAGATVLPTLVTPIPLRATTGGPALPPRHRGSVGEVSEEGAAVNGVINGGRAESWESKTWKEVVRLKEEIWKARVGVHDDA